MMVHYSFTNEDRTYYTDIITSFFAVIVSALLTYICFIGIEIGYALQASVEYYQYTSTPLGIIYGILTTIMIIFGIVKILELGYKELEDIQEIEI